MSREIVAGSEATYEQRERRGRPYWQSLVREWETIYNEAILKSGLDQQESPTCKGSCNAPLTHENVRGGDYYDKEETVH